jgi:predicted Rdx family selenoprotein
VFTQTSGIEISRTAQDLSSQESIDTISQAVPQQLQNLSRNIVKVQNIFCFNSHWLVCSSWLSHHSVAMFTTLIAFVARIFLTGALIVGLINHFFTRKIVWETFHIKQKIIKVPHWASDSPILYRCCISSF